jgi:23S rRNA-intervening sequence protein
LRAIALARVSSAFTHQDTLTFGEFSKRESSPEGRFEHGGRLRGDADFISKIEGSLQEMEESEYWLELLAEAGFYPDEQLVALKRETGELKGIFVSVVRNTKAKSKPPKP